MNDAWIPHILRRRTDAEGDEEGKIFTNGPERDRQEGNKGEGVGGLDSRWLQMEGREKGWITHERCSDDEEPFYNLLSNNLWCGRWGH